MAMTFGLQSRIRFGTWNVRILLKDTSLAQLVQEFRRYKFKILGISEMRWKESEELKNSTR